MSRSKNYINAVNRIDGVDKLESIRKRDFCFDYGCSVPVSREELISNSMTPRSYSIKIRVNDILDVQQKEIDRLKKENEGMHKSFSVLVKMLKDRDEIFKEYPSIADQIYFMRLGSFKELEGDKR